MMSRQPPLMNPWEDRALSYEYADEAAPDETAPVPPEARRRPEDPVFYPGLYSATGFDVMGILMQVISRPNPQIDLGPIDGSVALVVCDLNLPDNPIIYASESFCDLTGYSKAEAVGCNCRFLQAPPPGRRQPPKPRSSKGIRADKQALQVLGQAIQAREEVQVSITNYKKTGQSFMNYLSVIPLAPDASGCCYAVGLQVEI